MMKWIVLLLAICLSGLAAAQGMFTGEGYSSSQLAFYSGPNTSSFDSNVQQYWNDYVSNSGNASKAPVETATTRMSIWQSSFSYNFEQPITLANTSFAAGGQAADNMTTEERNSAMLERATVSNFEIGQNSAQSSASQSTSQTASGSGLSLGKYSNTPTAESSGQVLTQGISAGFSS